MEPQTFPFEGPNSIWRFLLLVLMLTLPGIVLLTCARFPSYGSASPMENTPGPSTGLTRQPVPSTSEKLTAIDFSTCWLACDKKAMLQEANHSHRQHPSHLGSIHRIAMGHGSVSNSRGKGLVLCWFPLGSCSSREKTKQQQQQQGLSVQCWGSIESLDS